MGRLVYCYYSGGGEGGNAVDGWLSHVEGKLTCFVRAEE